MKKARAIWILGFKDLFRGNSRAEKILPSIASTDFSVTPLFSAIFDVVCPSETNLRISICVSVKFEICESVRLIGASGKCLTRRIAVNRTETSFSRDFVKYKAPRGKS